MTSTADAGWNSSKHARIGGQSRMIHTKRTPVKSQACPPVEAESESAGVPSFKASAPPFSVVAAAHRSRPTVLVSAAQKERCGCR